MKIGKEILKKGVCFIMSLGMMTGAASIAVNGNTKTSAEDKQYVFNQGELQDNAFSRLPTGSVKAESWLLQQLLYQKEGITGLLHDNWDIYSEKNGWRGSDETGRDYIWEKGPCYLRGLFTLAWTLDDEELKKKAMEWIDPILESQVEETGYFGPKAYGDGLGDGTNYKRLDWWPHMMVLGVLRDYYEVTERAGDPDERVLKVLGGYFEYQLKQIPVNPLEYSEAKWAVARAGENIEVILWYYNRVYDPEAPEESDWLLGLAEMIAEQTGSKNCDRTWTDVFINTTVREHVVDTTLTLKTPAVLWQMTGKEEDRIALREAIRNWGIDHGRIDNMTNSDEISEENYPYRGTETCSVVESMLSLEVAISILGEGWIGDNLENLAYNTLPACFTSDFKGHVYFQAENLVMSTHGDHEFSDDRGNEAAYSAPSGYECCFPNMSMGWPKFVSNMWMATPEGGLAVIAYGPNKVTAKVSGGKTAIFHQITDYPFKDTIGIVYEGDTASFPLMLRVPAWCKSPSFKVNGEAVKLEAEKGYITVDRQWRSGDEVEIVFPMEIRVSHWYNDSVGIQYGALNFALGVKEDWRVVTDLSSAGAAYPIPEAGRDNGVYNYEAFAASDWNYALVLDTENIEDSFEIKIADEIPLQPFSLNNAPIRIKAKGQTIPEWKLRGNVVPEPPYSPIASDESLWEDIELVPYGSTRLRVTLMPWVGGSVPEDRSTYVSADDALRYTEDGESVLEFDNVMVRLAEDYDLKIFYEGSGSVTVNINSKLGRKLNLNGSGEYVIAGLKGLLPTCVDSLTKKTVKGFKFDFGQQNSIRFIGEGNELITGICVVPVSPYTEPKILSSQIISSSAVTVNTNISRDAAGFYTLEYGTRPGEYTHKIENNYGEKILVTGLTDSDTYYFRASLLFEGKLTYTNELKVEMPELESTETEAEKVSFTDDFSSASASGSDWNVYGDTGAVSYADGRMNVASSRNFKMFTGAETLTDYAIEATLSGQAMGSNFGVVFRASKPSGGHVDYYNGYYVGIMGNSSDLKLKIGYCDQAWHEAESTEVKVGSEKFAAGKDYTLKILVFGNYFRVYVDGSFVYEGVNNRFSSGNVGVRSYVTPFSVDSFTVRNLTDSEEAEFDGKPTETLREFELKDVKSTYGAIQLSTGFESPSHTYRIEYGTSSGEYTTVINNIYGLNRPTYAKLTTDRFCFSVPEAGTYYLRLVAMNGNEIAAVSKEYAVTSGEVLSVSDSEHMDRMKAALDGAKAVRDGLDRSALSEASVERLERAIEYAEKVENSEGANLAELSLAYSTLRTGVDNLSEKEEEYNPDDSGAVSEPDETESTAANDENDGGESSETSENEPKKPSVGAIAGLCAAGVALCAAAGFAVYRIFFKKK